MPRAGHLLQRCVEHILSPRSPSSPTKAPGLTKSIRKSLLSSECHTPFPTRQSGDSFCTAFTRCHPPFLRKDFSAHELPVTAINYCEAWPQLSEPNSLSLEFFELAKKVVPFGLQICELGGRGCLVCRNGRFLGRVNHKHCSVSALPLSCSLQKEALNVCF